MSIEAGVLVDLEGKTLFWHLPMDRSGGYLPDSRDLWTVIWENRANILGFAHSHPGSGETGPSMEDLTTFAAIEAALGRRLVWWITSADQLIELHWAGPEKLAYWQGPSVSDPEWLPELRKHSYYDHRMIRRWTATVPMVDMAVTAAEDAEIHKRLDALAPNKETQS